MPVAEEGRDFAVLMRSFLDRATVLSPITISALIYLARPLLRVHLAHYKRDVRHAPFPEDDPEFVIAGPHPDRLLFIGDVAVSGYGVLLQGMTTASQTARILAQNRRRGCVWKTICATDLTAAHVARMPAFEAADVDVAVIMLGVPDVLLATSLTTWAADLRTIADHIRQQAGQDCGIVFAGIPPMADFRPIPPVARTMLMLQVQRLNRVTQVIASEIDAAYAPFPALRVGEMYVQELFSWKSLHEKWACILAPATAQAMKQRRGAAQRRAELAPTPITPPAPPAPRRAH